MSQKQENLIVVLDVGSAFTRVLAADLNEGALRYRAHAQVESSGMRKGLISDLGPAAKAVKAANERAEWVARVNIDDPSDCLDKFRSNRIVGWLLFAGIVAGHFA